MQHAVRANLGGHRDIDGLGGVAGSQGSLLDLLRQCLILFLGPLLELVNGLADGRAILLGNVTQALGQACDLAVLAQVFLPEVRKLGFVGDGCAGLLNGGAQLFDFFFHSTPLFDFGPEQIKKPRPCVKSGTKPCTYNSPRYHPCSAYKKRHSLLQVTVQGRCALPGRNGLSRAPLGREFPHNFFAGGLQPTTALSGPKNLARTFSVIVFLRILD